MEKEDPINLKTDDIQKSSLAERIKSLKLLEEQEKFVGLKRLNSNSPLLKCIGFVQIEGVNGRDHDQFIYDKK